MIGGEGSFFLHLFALRPAVRDIVRLGRPVSSGASKCNDNDRAAKWMKVFLSHRGTSQRLSLLWGLFLQEQIPQVCPGRNSSWTHPVLFQSPRVLENLRSQATSMTGILLVCKPCRKVSLAPTNISQSKDLSSSVHSWSSEALHSIPSFVICSSSSWCRSWSPETNLSQRLCLGRCGVDFFDCRPGLSRNGSQTPSWFHHWTTSCNELQTVPMKAGPICLCKAAKLKVYSGKSTL